MIYWYVWDDMIDLQYVPAKMYDRVERPHFTVKRYGESWDESHRAYFDIDVNQVKFVCKELYHETRRNHIDYARLHFFKYAHAIEFLEGYPSHHYEHIHSLHFESGPLDECHDKAERAAMKRLKDICWEFSDLEVVSQNEWLGYTQPDVVVRAYSCERQLKENAEYEDVVELGTNKHRVSTFFYLPEFFQDADKRPQYPSNFLVCPTIPTPWLSHVEEHFHSQEFRQSEDFQIWGQDCTGWLKELLHIVKASYVKP